MGAVILISVIGGIYAVVAATVAAKVVYYDYVDKRLSCTTPLFAAACGIFWLPIAALVACRLGLEAMQDSDTADDDLEY